MIENKGVTEYDILSVVTPYEHHGIIIITYDKHELCDLICITNMKNFIQYI